MDNMTEKRPNHLIKENSPYLLQHAYNPVDWRPWGADALNISRERNKLLIISIGYAACHWCHVMEHESFEDDEVADAMNRDFVSVKVDREERPDIDHIYMAAAYATSGRGGWPLNVIALPDQRPVFAGTYYSKREWMHILNYFAELHQRHPEELFQQASGIATGMKKRDPVVFAADSDFPGTATLHEIYRVWKEDLDFINGGTPGAPKFPMPVNIVYLLAYGKQFRNREVLDYVELTLDKMASGGIYDHLGGGFSRYSVDAGWHVPHFEKMLYDNAQLIELYSQAYSETQKVEYQKVVEDTIAFIDREMTNGNALFYASIDADSAGTEGAFYAWTGDEIHKYLGDDDRMFMDYFSCEEYGNWEHQLNILRKSSKDKDFAEKHGITAGQLASWLDVSKNRLFTIRSKRIRPATDDKILTCWNGLMISALTTAAKALNNPRWLETAIAAADFYRVHLEERNGKLWRNSQAGSFAIAGFLDDYCFLIKAFLDIYQSTLDASWLNSAESLTREALLHFTAGDGLFFNLSSNEGPRLIGETVELSDNVIPASNSQMARNLFVLGHLLNHEGYAARSEAMLKKMISQVKQNPSFHANWMGLLAETISGPAVVTITGDGKLLRLQEFSKYYLPGVIFSGIHSQTSKEVSETTESKEKTMIRVCCGKTCFAPVETVGEALQILERQ